MRQWKQSKGRVQPFRNNFGSLVCNIQALRHEAVEQISRLLFAVIYSSQFNYLMYQLYFLLFYTLSDISCLIPYVSTLVIQQMEKNLQRSMVEMLQVQGMHELRDPALGQNSLVIYSNEHSFTIRIQQKPESIQTLKQPELLKVKVMVEYEHDFPKNIKIELTSDTEIYFNFVCECNDWEFKRIKANQNFFIEFKEYPDFILKNFERLAASDKYLASFTIFSENEGKLDLIRKSEFKDDTIMEFDFAKAHDEVIKKSIQYRYNVLRHEYRQYKSRYDSVCESIKQKNPSLAIQIQKIHKK